MTDNQNKKFCVETFELTDAMFQTQRLKQRRFTFKEVEKADTTFSCTICWRDPFVCFMEFNNCSNTWSLKTREKKNTESKIKKTSQAFFILKHITKPIYYRNGDETNLLP